MAVQKYTIPNQQDAGSSTFSDNLVGFQLVTGGGLTQGNFDFTYSFSEKSNRTFQTGTFSDPISLDSMNIGSVNEARAILENNYKVYPNFDVSQVTNFTNFGSLTKRISTSIETIINYFPAAIEVLPINTKFVSANTVDNIVFYSNEDKTSFEIAVSQLRNPFGIDYSVNADRNMATREVEVSTLRNLTSQYRNYVITVEGVNYDIIIFTPTQTLDSGTLKFWCLGNPFSGKSSYDNYVIIRPNDYYVNKTFNEKFDEVQNFLLNRLITPIYTSNFKVPAQDDDGRFFVNNVILTWPLDTYWNLDIRTVLFTNYLSALNDITSAFDEYKTNIISRFLVTGALQEFDTDGQKLEKVLQIYGRSFDESKKFIDALAFMNSVHYNVGNDIPSQLLKNLSQTLGWTTNMSPISNDALLGAVFNNDTTQNANYSAYSRGLTPDELNYQYYRNLILNSAYLFKSKGTRKSIESLLRLIGAPDAIVEFNEYVYLADQRINVNQFNTQFAEISGGTYSKELPALDGTNTFKIKGQTFSAFTTTQIIEDVNINKNDYPIDSLGYPSMVTPTDSYFYQMGSGWFESTPAHRSPQQVDTTNSLFSGYNPNYQTQLKDFTYGQDYLDKYRNLPYTSLGFTLTQTIDNKKSWADDQIGLRDNPDGNFDARYQTLNDNLVINVKNVDVFLNPAQGLLYDVWYMSNQYGYPIPDDGLKVPYPQRGGIDWTYINPEPKKKTFFEFAQTFWHNTINVRNRQYIGGGYPTLSSIYWKYLESKESCPSYENDNFTYDTMIEYVNGLGDYWIRLIEQMMPASTLWNTGVKMENSIFNRQKFVWRRQSSYSLIPVPCISCSATGNLFPTECSVSSIKCAVYPWVSNTTFTSFSSVLGYLLNQYLVSEGKTLGTGVGQCIANTLVSDWHLNVKLSGNTIIDKVFYTGYGLNVVGVSYPSSTEWLTALDTNLYNTLPMYGLGYYIDGNYVVIYTSDCSNNTGTSLEINVGINMNITCQ
jgi:hypothetical protein